jgi:hypothetical protein
MEVKFAYAFQRKARSSNSKPTLYHGHPAGSSCFVAPKISGSLFSAEKDHIIVLTAARKCRADRFLQKPFFGKNSRSSSLRYQSMIKKFYFSSNSSLIDLIGNHPVEVGFVLTGDPHELT